MKIPDLEDLVSNLIEFKNDSSLDWGPGLLSISPPSKMNNRANTAKDNFSLTRVKCKEEKVGESHRLLMRFVNEWIAKTRGKYSNNLVVIYPSYNPRCEQDKHPDEKLLVTFPTLCPSSKYEL